MNLSDELKGTQKIFIDTAPIIYYIEAHPQCRTKLCFV